MASAFAGDETAPFFGFLGAAAAAVSSSPIRTRCPRLPGLIFPIFPFFFRIFCCRYGCGVRNGEDRVGVASMGVMRSELVMKSIVPVVMAGVLGIYGLIIAVIVSTGINPKAKSYYLFDGYAHLSSYHSCELAGLSAGMATGIVGDAGVRANS